MRDLERQITSFSNHTNLENKPSTLMLSFTFPIIKQWLKIELSLELTLEPPF